MYISLGFLAAGISFDILFHKFSESGPFVLFVNKFPGVRYARMSSYGRIVKGLEDVSS